MFEYAALFLTLLVFILASIEDIKKREVYDFLNFFYAFGILLIALLASIMYSSATIFISVLFGMSMGFAIGYLLFKGGLWGGGDAKFMLGFGGASVLMINFFSFSTLLSQNILFLVGEFRAFEYAKYLLLLLNIIIFLFFLYRIVFEREQAHRKDLIRGLLFFSLLIGLILLDFSLLLSILLLSFAIVIFLFSDEVFTKALYVKEKIKVSELKEGHNLHHSVRKGKTVLVPYQDATLGLKSHHIALLQKEYKKEEELVRRKVLPLLTIIELNLFFFIFSYILSTEIFLATTLYLFSFIFVSFVLGGLAALLIILYVVIRYWKELKVSFSKISLLSSGLFLLLAVLTALFYETSFALPFILLAFFIPFISMAKAAESYLFVSKKDLEQIVPGDWIVEDVKVKSKLIYKKEEFNLGISEQQLKTLKKMAKEKGVELSYLVKDGIAFIPALFLGFLALFLL
jgi:Flp pilus assembly protein protease CpaA